MPYADYAYYQKQYGGASIGEADFPRLSRVASHFLDSLTMGKAAKVTDPKIEEKIKDACCAMAEAQLLEERGGAVLSASNDGYTEQYAVSKQSIERKMYRIAATILAPTGLLFRGLGGDGTC